jgi:hypothetical protein
MSESGGPQEILEATGLDVHFTRSGQVVGQGGTQLDPTPRVAVTEGIVRCHGQSAPRRSEPLATGKGGEIR